MANEVIVSLGGHDWKSSRGRLGKYLALFEVNRGLSEAANRLDTGGIADSLYEYLSTCNPDLTRDLFDSAPWFEVTKAYYSLVELNAIPQAERFAILTKRAGDEDIKPLPWDYPGRLKTVYIHIIANAYGWSQTQILNMWPEDAITYIQEILADEQFEREFLHAHAEVSYGYNKATKKSTFQQLERPAWMVLGSAIEQERKMAEIKKELIPKIMLPAGVVRSIKKR